jgi:large subunit ribosomal protein L16
MLEPKKLKHRKWQKGRSLNKHLVATRTTNLDFGQFGLKATTEAWITSRQIEAARRALTHCIKRGGRVWIRIFPDKPITTKGTQSVMGSGKGAPDHFVAVVRPGMILFEMEGVTEEMAKEALRLASHKLPVLTRFVTK